MSSPKLFVLLLSTYLVVGLVSAEAQWPRFAVKCATNITGDVTGLRVGMNNTCDADKPTCTLKRGSRNHVTLSMLTEMPAQSLFFLGTYFTADGREHTLPQFEMCDQHVACPLSPNHTNIIDWVQEVPAQQPTGPIKAFVKLRNGFLVLACFELRLVIE